MIILIFPFIMVAFMTLCLMIFSNDSSDVCHCRDYTTTEILNKVKTETKTDNKKTDDDDDNNNNNNNGGSRDNVQARMIAVVASM